MPASILVTGASGLLGQETVRLLADSYSTFAVVRNAPENPHSRVHYVCADLQNCLDPKVLPNRIDHIIHLAQSRRYREGPGGSADVVSVNALATARLLEYARLVGAKSFLFASSGGVYQPSFSVKSEASPVRQLDELTPYFASKVLGEALVNAYTESLQIKTLRFFFIYSSSQLGSGLIGRLRSQVLSGETIRIHGKGPQMNPIHVSDAARAIEAAVAHQGSLVSNVAGSEIVRLRLLVEHISKQLNRKPLIQSHGRPSESLVGDISRMRHLLCVPEYTLAQAFRECPELPK